jgi:hypothetical protein
MFRVKGIEVSQAKNKVMYTFFNVVTKRGQCTKVETSQLCEHWGDLKHLYGDAGVSSHAFVSKGMMICCILIELRFWKVPFLSSRCGGLLLLLIAIAGGDLVHYNTRLACWTDLPLYEIKIPLASTLEELLKNRASYRHH